MVELIPCPDIDTEVSCDQPQSSGLVARNMRLDHFLSIAVSLDNSPFSSSPSFLLLSDTSSLANPTVYRFLYSRGSSIPTPSFHIPLLAALDDHMSQCSQAETSRLPRFLLDAQKRVASPRPVLGTTLFIRGGSPGA